MAAGHLFAICRSILACANVARKSNRIIQFQYKDDDGDNALRPKHTKSTVVNRGATSTNMHGKRKFR